MIRIYKSEAFEQPEFQRLPKQQLLRRVLRRVPVGTVHRALETTDKKQAQTVLKQQGYFGNEGTVRKYGSRYWQVKKASFTTSDQAYGENLKMLTELLTNAGVRYFAIPHRTGSKVVLAVLDDEWTDMLDAVEKHDAAVRPYVGVGMKNVRRKNFRWTSALEEPVARKAAEEQQFIEVFQMYTKKHVEKVYGRSAAIRVERWFAEDDGSYSFPGRSVRTNLIAPPAQVPATIERYGVELPTFASAIKPHAMSFEEPVDLVYMWVDGADEVWLRKRNRVISELTGEVFSDSIDASRFRDNGELKYSLRSVVPHLDWVRNIFIVTDDQTPEWLNVDHPRIRMVSHREMFGDAGQLPTFNSHAIGSRLHHIDGLAEHYLVVNDDVFFGLHARPNNFFFSNGISKFFLSQATLPLTDEDVNAHEAARRNVVDLLEDEFGKTVTNAFYHTPIPQLKSHMFELEQKYSMVFEGNLSSQLRSRNDFEVNGWLHHYHGLLTGRSLPSRITYDYFNLADSDAVRRMKNLSANESIIAFCVNDSPDADETNVKMAIETLRERYPTPAEWEL